MSSIKPFLVCSASSSRMFLLVSETSMLILNMDSSLYIGLLVCVNMIWFVTLHLAGLHTGADLPYTAWGQLPPVKSTIKLNYIEIM